ncbi:hydrogen peroxide-inducible genes activator [Aureibacter tunicatorum]|uniref:LysR family hydrogen peroxide-inducible transcriptional activator n=1 Tax=Aureibacter tunicatorum TaxID=866807 RepID=A0AAE4BTE2_9BACT|nr:hydrogen peroxide-inducible genes activator [Aureibacter tunicatorum]MDR6239845.1 LysR family hydrogen peroxide-inducible transcriptional activator [Aureibacter tunicatorum]BDD04320.1 transcriptional regulator [Aureibacter tunicatorum]
MNITFAQLEYIIAVDTYRHFVTAAEKCFVTQPTLSMQIKKLEEQLGVIIFDRSKQPIIPTDVGKEIIAQSRTVVANAKKINDIILDYKDQVSGELKIGIIPTIAPYLLPKFIGSFINKYPNIKLSVKEMITDDIISSLQKDTLDAGILATPLNTQGIHEDPLYYEEFKLYVNKAHSLKDKNFIEINEISINDLWLLSSGNCFRNQSINLCHQNNENSRNSGFEYESGSLETLKKLVNTEGGATLLPDLATLDEPDNGRAQIKSIGASAHPVREISLVYTRNFAKMKLLSLLKESIKESVPKSMLEISNNEIINIS